MGYASADGKPQNDKFNRFNREKREMYLALMRRRWRKYKIAAHLNIDPSTPHKYAEAHPEYAKAMQEAENAANESIEDVMYEQSLKGVPQLLLAFLYNRMPDRWQDKRAVKPEAPKEAPSQEMLMMMMQEMLKMKNEK